MQVHGRHEADPQTFAAPAEDAFSQSIVVIVRSWACSMKWNVARQPAGRGPRWRRPQPEAQGPRYSRAFGIAPETPQTSEACPLRGSTVAIHFPSRDTSRQRKHRPHAGDPASGNPTRTATYREETVALRIQAGRSAQLPQASSSSSTPTITGTSASPPQRQMQAPSGQQRGRSSTHGQDS